MITVKDFFSKLRLGWMFVFASFTLWCAHMNNKSPFDFWIDGFYNFDNEPEELELNWSTYEIAMKYQKKPRGRGKLKYPPTIEGFLKWQNERKKEPQKVILPEVYQPHTSRRTMLFILKNVQFDIK